MACFQMCFWFLTAIILSVRGAGMESFYPFGATIDETLTVGDDAVSGMIQLKHRPIVYYSQRKHNVSVSINGLISFDGPLPEYTGELLPLGREVIAPFYADVDTRSTGEVFYRETTDAAELDRAASDINRVFRPEDKFEPWSLLIVTWVNVGAYSAQFDRRNTFQLMIATDGFRSYAVFLYMDNMIQWIQAQLKNENVAEVSAQAGFDSGRQQFAPVVLPGSGFPEAMNWNIESNAGIPGVWMYKIGYLIAIEQPDVDLLATIEPAPSGPDSTGSTCAHKCSSDGRCEGNCCVCNLGYNGNGISCLKGERVWVNGKVIGTVNENELDDDTSLHVYAAIREARTYTAISKLPPLTGYPLQLLVPLGELMGWLFADAGNSDNGFSITGAMLNYSATITVGADVLQLEVIMNGARSDDKLNDLRISINGNLPANTHGSRALFQDRVSNYTKISKGRYVSESRREYTVNEQLYQFDLREVINFNECKEAPQIYRISHSGYFVNYNENELTTRFSLVSETEVSDDIDVCAGQRCHHNADCVPKDSSYTCTCKMGYEGSGQDCVDLDECVTGGNTCSEFADCTNTDGGYTCKCITGYSGDGYFCAQEERRISCRDLGCHSNAVCQQRGVQPYCVCKEGFHGDGKYCEAIVVTCNEADICDSDAVCVYNYETSRYECQCRDGFSGDGETCETPIDASCAYCSFNAQCVYNTEGLYYHCICQSGYTGDGRSCQLIDQRESRTTTTTTQAPPTTDRERENNCYYNRELCDVDAYCALSGGEYKCTCRDGFLSSGSRCVRADCRSHRECGENAHCQYSPQADRYKCKCNDGFQGDGQLCSTTSVTTCNEVNVCHLDADCFDTTQGPKCVCRSGFVGDGLACSPLQDNCMTRPALCDRNAVCSRTSAGDFVCICNPGYRGDGSLCAPLNEQGNHLIFSQGMSIFRVPFYQAGSDMGTRILHKSGQTLVGLAADCRERRFYFSDINSGTISRASLDNSSDSEVIISGLSSPEGLAVDWVSRTLFFTDSALNRIEVSDLEGKYRKVIVDSDLVNVRAIAVDPSAGKIYWTDWNRNSPRIEAANMDGTGRQVLVDTGLGLPNGLTFDLYRRQVCWADAGTQKLECVDTDGRSRTVIYDLANHPFGLTSFRDNFYWTDWNKNAIQSIPRGGDKIGSSILFPAGGNGKAYSIEPVPSQCLPGTNRCRYNNGGCKFLCLPTSDSDATCACPDNIDQDECNQIFRS